MPDSAVLVREQAFRGGGLALTPAAILSVATDLPPERLTSAELAERLGVTEEWIMTRTGIRERRVARPEERLSDYATRAGARALEAAGVDAANLDLVIVATLSQDEVTPNTAPIVAHNLGATGAGAFDVLFLETGYHFPETIGTRDAVDSRTSSRLTPRAEACWSARPPGASHRSPAIGPGDTEFTSTPRSANRSANARESDSSAALVTE